ncbi:MAG: acetylornithine/succinylornithine family transaminase [Atopobiaceae bacterium]|jgi:acetylornithine/N-succinyldiaminopimelate aminotransferase
MTQTYTGALPQLTEGLDYDYLWHTYGRLPVEFVKGQGATLTDAAGNVYLDFLAGIGAVSCGHAHPALVSALTEQAKKLWQVGNYYHIEHRGELAHKVSDLLSCTCDNQGNITGSTGSVFKVFFSNSGAESNEGAIKLARRWGEKNLGGAHTILTAQRSFHGRTLATLSATGQDVFHQSFLPMPEGFDFVPLNDIAALKARLEDLTEGETHLAPCAIMLECIQGESGVYPATETYLKAVRELCDSLGLLLIIDEVQTGFFRCGAPFCYQLSGIEPDVVSMAKGIGSGFPMGAVAAKSEVADLMQPGDHGSTFGGNPLAAAAGLAAVTVLEEEHLGNNAIATGSHLARRLADLPHVKEVRGAGLMRAAEFDLPIATRLVEQGLGRGLVLNHIGENILRFLPPLVVSAAQVDEMADTLTELICDLCG